MYDTYFAADSFLSSAISPGGAEPSIENRPENTWSVWWVQLSNSFFSLINRFEQDSMHIINHLLFST